MKWIDASQRKPKSGKWVLISLHGSTVVRGKYYKKKNKWFILLDENEITY